MKIAPGVYSLSQKMGGHVHAFLIDNGEELTLIDSLFDPDAHRVLELLHDLGRDITDLKHIVVTHAHRSHLGGLATLKRLSGASIYAHEWEADIIAGQRKSQSVTLKPTHPLLTWAPTYYLQFGQAVGAGAHPPCPVDHTITTGDYVGSLQVFHAPGHSPGHLAFYLPDPAILFVGDAVATWPTLAPGWPAFNLNPTQQRATLHRLAEFEASIVAVGHGEAITEGATDRVHGLAIRMQ